MSRDQTDRGFHLVGERPWLDFVNTEAVESGQPVDLLQGFDDLVAWCVAAKVLGAQEAEPIARRWRGSRDAERAFAEAIQFRAALRKTAERLAAGRVNVEQSVLDRINAVLSMRTGELVLAKTKQGYETRFRPRFDTPAQLMVPIAESVAELLSTGNPGLVRKCQNAACVLYFYDTTKNHARRWCSMTACGNRAKVAAHYRRTRNVGAP